MILRHLSLRCPNCWWRIVPLTSVVVDTWDWTCVLTRLRYGSIRLPAKTPLKIARLSFTSEKCSLLDLLITIWTCPRIKDPPAIKFFDGSGIYRKLFKANTESSPAFRWIVPEKFTARYTPPPASRRHWSMEKIGVTDNASKHDESLKMWWDAPVLSRSHEEDDGVKPAATSWVLLSVTSPKVVQNHNIDMLATDLPTIFIPHIVEADLLCVFDFPLLSASWTAIHFSRLEQFLGFEK